MKPPGAEWGLEQSSREGILSPPQLLHQHLCTPGGFSLPGAPVLPPLHGTDTPLPAFSPALWTFLWFVGFCFLTNQWAATKADDVRIGADSARAAITFSFFSIFSWVSGPRVGQGPGVSGEGWCRAEEPKPWGSLQGVLASLAYQRYKAGVDDFIQNYVDPTPDPNTAYASYPGVPADTYQQPPFTQNAESTEGYQPPPVY